MYVENPTTRPRRIFGEDVEMAALVDEAVGEGLEEALTMLLTAALRSCGYTKVAEPARFINPSFCRTSLLAARNVRVYMMFSAA